MKRLTALAVAMGLSLPAEAAAPIIRVVKASAGAPIAPVLKAGLTPLTPPALSATVLPQLRFQQPGAPIGSNAPQAQLAETGDVLLGEVGQAAELPSLQQLKQWRYIGFHGQEDLGEPTINGLPASESKLEFKHVRRGTRHDYSLLALGATPPGEYKVAFQNGKELTVHVEASKDAPSRRGDEDTEPPAPQFAAGVDEMVQKFLSNHLSYMGRHLPEYEGYVRNDPTLTEEGRAEALREVESLRATYADVVNGKTRWALDGVVAQLMARERDIMEAHKEYVRNDPSHGRAYAGFAVEQMEHYRKILGDLYKIYSQVDRNPGPVVRAVGAVVEAWYRARVNVAFAWANLRARLKLALRRKKD